MAGSRASRVPYIKQNKSDTSMENREIKLPSETDVRRMCVEDVQDYVRFVATLRHAQRRYFATRKPDALETSKRMERELDRWNDEALNPQPKLL